MTISLRNASVTVWMLFVLMMGLSPCMPAAKWMNIFHCAVTCASSAISVLFSDFEIIKFVN